MHQKGGSYITVALPKLIYPFTCLVAELKNIISEEAIGTAKRKDIPMPTKTSCGSIPNGSLFMLQ